MATLPFALVGGVWLIGYNPKEIFFYKNPWAFGRTKKRDH